MKPNLIDIERVTLSDHHETFFKSKYGQIVMRPDFEYLIEFNFDPTSISYNGFIVKHSLILSQGDDSIIKQFIFNLL